MAQLLDGKEAAKGFEKELKEQIALLRQKGIVPRLAVILAGSGKPSAMYASFVKKRAESYGAEAEIYVKPDDVGEEEMEDLISSLNRDANVNGILMMMPLPKGLNTEHLIHMIDPEKDLDGLTTENQGRFFSGKEGFRGGTPSAVMALLHYYHIDVEGKDAVVVGRSNVIGKPVSLMLLQENATVTVCHSHTKNLAAVTRRADLLISAVGRPGFITADMVKPGAVVVDVGINRAGGKTVGDVDYEGVFPIAGAITPVPGGVGSVTTAMMIANLVKAAEKQNGIR